MELNVKIRSHGHALHTTKVNVDGQDPAVTLKKKICEKVEGLQEDMIVVTYCGSEMEDSCPVISYDLFDGATVHVFKRNKHEKETVPPAKMYNERDLIRLSVALRSLASNSPYYRVLTSKTTPSKRNELILQYPGLATDPVGFTLLLHPELLAKCGDVDVLKRLQDQHPTLLQVMSDIYAAVSLDLQTKLNAGILPSVYNPSDEEMEDIEDMDDSSPASEAGSQPLSRNSSFGANITAAQLASAIASVTTHQPLPSTSGASTSTGSSDAFYHAFNRALGQNQQTPTDTDLTARLQTMRDMGLTNDAVNVQALRMTNSLESAINIVLSGFIDPEN